MKSIKHRILLTTGLLVGITVTGIKVNANDDLTPVNQSSESSTTTTANSTVTTEAVSTTATPATADKQVSWQTPQAVDSSTGTSQTNSGYGDQNATASGTQTTGSTGQASTVNSTQPSSSQNSQTVQESTDQSTSSQASQTQTTATQSQTSSSSNMSNDQTETTNNQQATSQQVQTPISAATTHETNQASSITHNQSTSQSTTRTASNTPNNGQTNVEQGHSASPQKVTAQVAKRSNAKSTSQSKDNSKRVTAAKATHQAKSKANDNQRATQKTYIYYEDVNPNNPNEYGRIIYSEVKDGQTKYYGYSTQEKKYSLITDASMLDEIKGAFDDHKVKKYHMENLEELQEALQVDPNVENVGEYRIIKSTVNPGNDIESIYEVVRNYYELGKGTDDRYVIKIGNDYYEYNEETGEFNIENPVTDDVKKAKEAQVVKHQYADPETLAEIKKALEQNPDLSTYKNYDVKTVTELPEGITPGLYFVIHDGHINEYSKPSNPADGATVVPVYFDGYDYHKFDVASGKFEKLTEAELEELSAAQEKKVVEKQLLTNGSDYTEALKKAVENGHNYVTIDGQTYMIYSVADQKDVPEGTPSYTMLIPHALPKTDLKEDKKLTALETINPGVKVTIADYWLTTADGNEDPTNIGMQGINNGKVLKFGSGQSGSGGINNGSDIIKKGIVKNNLGSDGYPVLSINDESLNYLFNEENGDFKKVYTNNSEVKMFISDGKGGYRFDSSHNHALINSEGEMIIYNLPNKPIREPGIEPESQFFPFDDKDIFFNDNGTAKEYNPRTISGSGTPGGINHYFGVKMALTYIHPEGGQISNSPNSKTDMIFNFSGDDDFWLFIDGRLVLDIGGIHPARSGAINFATGEVETNDDKRANTTNLANILEDGWDKTGSQHEIAIFYLERGKGLSNFKMNFNLKIPSHNYAEREAYAVKKVPIVTGYVYGDHENYSTTDTPQWTYGVNEKYGVRFTPVGPGPNHSDT